MSKPSTPPPKVAAPKPTSKPVSVKPLASPLSPTETLPYMTKVAVLSIVANVVLTIAVIFLGLALSTKKIEAYGLTDSGSAIPLVALSDEYATESRVSAFAEECLRRAFEHDYEHYRKTTTQASACFTTTGVDSYMGQIVPLTAYIDKHRMVMSISAEPPVVVRKGSRGAFFEWEVQSVATIYMTGNTERVPPAKYNATMVIRRVPLTENIRGISMSFVNLKPFVETQSGR